MCALRGDRIGMIFQEPMTALNPVHTIGRQVGRAAAAAPRPVRRPRRARRRIALLDRVGIPDAARRIDAYPHQFSGGQRQRITIAMALACGPDLLIADEPTTALDVTIQRQILDLIRELVAERGMALILISHDLGVIAQNVRAHAGDVRRQRGRERPDGDRCSPTARIPTRWACSRRGPALRAAQGPAAGDHPGHACPSWSTCRRAARSPGRCRFTIPDCHVTRAAAVRGASPATRRAASGWTRSRRKQRTHAEVDRMNAARCCRSTNLVRDYTLPREKLFGAAAARCRRSTA